LSQQKASAFLPGRGDRELDDMNSDSDCCGLGSSWDWICARLKRTAPNMSETPRKPYDPPIIKKPTPESARLLIIRHGSAGDQKTKELLELLELIETEPPVKS